MSRADRILIPDLIKQFGIPCDPGIRITREFPLIGKAQFHRDLADQLHDALTEVEEKNSHLISSYAGTYNCRKAKLQNGKESRYWSRHAFPTAIDLNHKVFPYGSRIPQDPLLDRIMKKHGFANALTDYGISDSMHYEWQFFVKKQKGDDKELFSVQSEKPVKEFWAEGLFSAGPSAQYNYGRGDVWVNLRTDEEGKKSTVRLYVCSNKKGIEEVDLTTPLGNVPRSDLIEKDLGGFGIHFKVIEGPDVVIAVNQH